MVDGFLHLVGDAEPAAEVEPLDAMALAGKPLGQPAQRVNAACSSSRTRIWLPMWTASPIRMPGRLAATVYSRSASPIG